MKKGAVMPKFFSYRSAECAICTLLLICAAGQPAQAQRSVEELKIRYEQVCEQARSLEDSVSGLWIRRALIHADIKILEGGTGHILTVIAARQHDYSELTNQLEATEIAAQWYRSMCIANRQAYLEALTEQIILTALTEPSPEPVVRQTIRQTQQTTRQTRRPPRPPRNGPRRQYYDAQAADALITIIGGVVAGSRSPGRSGGSIGHGHRHNRPIP